MIARDFAREWVGQYEDVNYFKNLDNCILDAQQAALDEAQGPVDPVNFGDLMARLEACRSKLPPLYRENVVIPYTETLKGLGEIGFNQILMRDINRTGEACLMLDVAQAILQHGEGYDRRATQAYQEVVSDLYDGFLSAEDRRDIKPPDLDAIAPLVK